MERQDFLSAAIYNNRPFIEEWLDGQPEEAVDKQLLGELLRKAAQYGSASVVELLVTHVDDINEQVQAENEPTNGWAAMHFASAGYENVESNQVTNLLLVIYKLMCHGANPTLRCSSGHQPKQLAQKTGFELGVVFLDIAEKIWMKNKCDNPDDIPVMDIAHLVNAEKLPTLYKHIACWCFNAGKFEVLEWISATLVDPKILDFCLEANSDGMSLYHFAASIKDTLALNQILKHKTPVSFANDRVVTDSTGTTVTPLSLMISNNNFQHIIMLKDWDSVSTTRLTKIDLSKTNVEVFSLRLLCFSSVETLILDSTGLKMLTMEGALPMPDIKSVPLKLFKAPHNQLTEIPPDLFCLPKLNRLDVSDNQIERLPDNWWEGLVLESLNVSKNKLEEVPLPEVPGDNQPYIGVNHHTLCGRSELIFNELPKIPTHYGVTTQEEFFSPLLTLTLNTNNIMTFPRCLSCCVPILKYLDLSHNLLTDIPPINELPLSLENLNVSHNNLTCKDEEDTAIFRVSFDKKMCAAARTLGSEYRRCHHKSHTTLPKLCTLNLSNNPMLNTITVHGKLPTVDPDASFSIPGKDISVHLFFPHLYRLDISHCDLAELPQYFGRMNLVDQLNISYNPRLKIPVEVCQLKNLFEFEYHGIDDEETIKKLDTFNHVKEKVQFLNPLYGKSAGCCSPSIKLMIVGSKGHGRSTLLKYLKLSGVQTSGSGPVTSFLRSLYPDWNEEQLITQTTARASSPPGSLDIGLWNCVILDGAKPSKKAAPVENKHVSFCTWCFKGEDKNIQQCFFTASAVYVVCLKATEGLKGVVELEGWLLHIKARAAMSHVVIAVTHCDQLPKGIRRKEQDRILDAVNKLYAKKSKVYPTIHAVEFVSCYEGKKDFADISKLAHVLYNVAHKVETISTYRANQKIKILKQNIPKGFAELQHSLTGTRMASNDHYEQSAHVLIWSELKRMIREKLTYLVPAIVHFMDETFTDSVVDDAVTYLIYNGTLIHYNSPALSDLYFTNPQWLYDLLASVVTVDYGSSSIWDRGSRHNGKLNRLQLEQTFSERGLPPAYVGSFIKLLCNFEIAVPLDAETLLIPSLIDDAADKHSHILRTKYTFPRQDVRKHIADSSAAQGSVYAAKVLPAVAGIVHATRKLMLHTTGLCYRRIVLLHHIPISFWARLLARCLSSASHFYKIILNNCVSDMAFQRLANPGDVVIGQIPCQWIYWKTGITLDFDNRPLLFVSNLVNPNDVDEEGTKKPFSNTVGKIAHMGLFMGREWQHAYGMFKNGFEINVPDYILESWSENDQIGRRISYLLSAQIMSHILEIIDEVLKEWFEGDSGLYSSASTVIQQFVPCPHCFGDEKTPEGKQFKEDNVNINLQESSVDEVETTFSAPIPRQRFATVAGSSPTVERSINHLNLPNIVQCKEEETELFKHHASRNRSNSANTTSWNFGNDSSAGFTFKHCMWASQNGNGTIKCPHHGNLKLLDLIPDVVFRDMLHNTIDKSCLRGQHMLLGKGGFGTVYKVKLYKSESNTLEDVVVKVISTQVHNMAEGQSESLDVIVDKYADIRLELNKLCSSSHKYIVRFIGMTNDPMSFILEWAPIGSFRKILSDYREAHCAICPESVLLSIQQISSALNYLHQEKSIVHFDLKPDNVLVFHFPAEKHQCYETGKPLESLSCICCKTGVLVKLADLGISAFIGPGGFHRKLATPGHTAPEAIRHMGKEQMTEKVDIFSLGVSLYELMTLRELPPEGIHPASFDTELEKGRRPQFISVDPKYPQILNDCLVSCWSQDYVQRPSAQELDHYMKPVGLSLVNSYNLGELTVKDVLVVTLDNTETLWIASTLKRGDVEEDMLSVYALLDSESGPAFKMDVCRTTLKSAILSLCQVDSRFVWIACQDGSIAICDINTQSITKYCSFDELVKDGQLLRCMCTIGSGVVVLAYYHGMLAFIKNESLSTSEQHSSLLKSIDRLMLSDNPLPSSPSVVTKQLDSIGCLNTIEAVVDGNDQQTLWCGCDQGIIYIVESDSTTWEDNFQYHSLNYLKFSAVKVALQSNKLDAEGNIVQLKSVFNSALKKTIIYGLHETIEQKSFVISCWNTDQSLLSVIRLDEQVFTILPWSDGIFVVGKNKYKIQKISATDGSSITVLPGYHRQAPVYLTAMQAYMSPNGFLSSIGHSSSDGTGAFIPCNVLISVGKGCKGPLQNFSQIGDSKTDNTHAILHVVTKGHF